MLARNEDYVDLSTPSAKGLAYALRHPEIWPKGFRWFFPDCKRCAIGLAHALWPQTAGTSFDLLQALGYGDGTSAMIYDDEWRKVRSVFFNGNSETTPAEVADKLEAVI